MSVIKTRLIREISDVAAVLGGDEALACLALLTSFDEAVVDGGVFGSVVQNCGDECCTPLYVFEKGG